MAKDKLKSSKLKKVITSAFSSAFFYTDRSADSRLKFGDSGSKVEELQRTLRVLELYDYPERDGFFGISTRNAVMSFQREHNLNITGVADSATLAEIDRALNEYYPHIDFVRVMRINSVGDDVRALQRLLKSMGYFGARIDGVFSQTTASAVRTFQFDYGMAVDGVVNERLAKKINSVAASLRPFHEQTENDKVAVENKAKLDEIAVKESEFHTDAIKVQWSAINELWGMGKTMSVTDINSGNSFVLRRTGGKNHADVEPATEEDTEKLRQLFGGSWSWERKPVIISFSYITSAASICGMPHGDQDLCNNGVEGHFCMHFFESLTDDSIAATDIEHQRAIDIASRFVRKTEETKEA